MKKRFLPRRGMLCGVLAFFFILCLGWDSEVLARAGRGKSFKSGGSSSSKSYQQNPGSPPSSPQKNYQHQSQPPQPQPTLLPLPPAPPSTTKTGFFSGFAGGVTGAVLGGMLFRSLGITVPGWGEGFGMVDIFLILLVLGILFYEVKRLRDWRVTKSATTRAGRSPFSYPSRTSRGNRPFPMANRRGPVRPPGIK